MGYHLYREVKRYAPDDLDTGELALLLILADEANDQTRECFPGMDELCAHMRMSWDGISRILKRLAARGLDVRVAVGKDSRGRVVYAYKGMRTTYKIPRFAPATGPGNGQTPGGPLQPQRSDPSATNSTQRTDTSPTISEQRSDAGPSMVRPQSDPSPQFPHEEEDPHLLPPQRILRTAGLTLGDEDEKTFINWINKDTRKGTPWWRTVAKNGDLPGLVEDWRASLTPTAPKNGTKASWRDTEPCGTCDPTDRTRTTPDGRLYPCPTCNHQRHTDHINRHGDWRTVEQREEDDWYHQLWDWEQAKRRGEYRPRPVNAPAHLYEGLI